jgi:hypothetical protein
MLQSFLDRRRGAVDTVLLCLAPLALAALVASFVWNVEAMAGGAPWRLLGWQPRPCPGCAACGLSRAFSAVSHGRWSEALHFNLGVLALYPATCLTALAGTCAAVRLIPLRRV